VQVRTIRADIHGVKALVRSILERAAARSPRVRGMLAGLVGAHLTDLDRDFLAALPDGTTVDLDRQLELAARDPSLPSLLWAVLWEACARGAVRPGLRKRVEFRLAGRSFAMELDLGESPECGYLFRNPTPTLTRRLLAGGDAFLDVGANAGFHALSGALFFRQVVAIEPTPATAERLRRSRDLCGFGHVRVEPIALGAADGEATLAVHPGHCGTNRIAADRGDETSVTVPIRRLDALVADPTSGLVGRTIDFVKIDVEGHEVAVLEGARTTIARDRPDLFVEFNDAASFARFGSGLPKGYAALVARPDGSTRPVRDAADALANRDILFRGR